MKKVILSFSLIAFLAFSMGCGGNQNSDTTGTTSDTVKKMDQTTDTSTTASTVSATKDTSMSADRDFLMDAGSGGVMEVQLGKLAQVNAASAQVKEFGQMMITDHSKANTELKGIAEKKNVSVSPTPLEKQQKKIDDLKSKKGAEFDKAYVDLMVDDHKEDISKFQDEANKGNDADVKAFASKTLPVLTKHLEHIQKIKDGMKK